MKKKNNRVLTILGIILEVTFISWHIYMQRVIYKALWEREMRQANPRGTALFYISLMHLINNLWIILVLLLSKIPSWLLIFRIFNASIIFLAIDNYLRQYTGSGLPDRILLWLKPKD